MKSLFENKRRSCFSIAEDWVFHYIFSRDTVESKKALIAILNVILQREDDPIIDLQIMNPNFYGETKADKASILDIRASTNAGDLIDIEIQNGNTPFYADRSVYYGGRLVNSALASGEEYDKMKKSIVISIINGKLFPHSEKLHTVFQLREPEQGFLLSDRLELHFIELGKVDGRKKVDEMDAVEKLAAYMRYAGEADQEPYLCQLIKTGGEAIEMTEKLFKELTEDQIAFELRESQIRYEHDQASWKAYFKNEGLREGRQEGLQEGRQEGRQEGLQEGLEQGLEQGKRIALIDMICKKLAKGKSPQTIAIELDEDPTYIRCICDTALHFAPDYDSQKIYEEMKQSE